MRYGGQLQPFKLQQKLHGHADKARHQQQAKIASPKEFFLSQKDGQEQSATEDKSIADVVRDRHLAKSDFAEEKAGAPQASGCSKRSVGPQGVAARARFSSDGCAHTMPLRNSSSGYFVPRQITPSFHRV